jgi:amino acid transporter
MLCSVRIIVCQVFVPFEPRPAEIDSLPEPAIKIGESEVKECQWIFDQAEARRLQLEQKAQSTFGLMVFLVPLLASLFVFLVNRATIHATSRTVAIALLVVSACLVLLGFISVVRAISVKTFETLYLGAVIDLKDGQFRQYDHAFHARGLLYCASMNTAMNDHIAQFVKGGQILIAGAVIAVLAAAVPAATIFSSLAPAATEAKLVGSVNVSTELTALREEVASLRAELGALANGKTAKQGPKTIGARAPTHGTNLGHAAKKTTLIGPERR